MFSMKRSAVWVGLLAALAPCSGQDEKPVHLEVPDQPPVEAADLPSERSPAGRWTRGGLTAVQVNVDSQGANIVGDAANEPSIAVDPNDPNRMAVGWRQFDSIASSFRKAGWAYSDDGGLTWTAPGSIQSSFRSDPVLDVDSQGNFYYNSLNGSLACDVFRSSDGGVSWGPPTPAQGGDKQWMAIDRSGGPGDGHIYAFWSRFFSACSGSFTRSTDGGASYPECVDVPGSPSLGTIAVGPDGAVYIAGGGGSFAKSTTLQDPGTAAQFDFSRTVALGGNTATRVGPNPDGLLGQMYVAVDHSAGATAGNVYLLASVNPPGPDPLDVAFVRSEDGGQTWSAPIRVNDDPSQSNAWQWFAMMDTAPNGRIDAVWNDTRNHDGSFLSELFYAYSTDGGRNWSANTPLTPAFDPHLGFPQQNKIGDYNDIVSHNDAVHVIFSATFNGEQDVYYLRIPNPAAGCREDVNGDGEVNEADLSLIIAAWGQPGGLGDVGGDGSVDIRDAIAALAAFGPCQ